MPAAGLIGSQMGRGVHGMQKWKSQLIQPWYCNWIGGRNGPARKPSGKWQGKNRARQQHRTNDVDLKTTLQLSGSNRHRSSGKIGPAAPAGHAAAAASKTLLPITRTLASHGRVLLRSHARFGSFWWQRLRLAWLSPCHAPLPAGPAAAAAGPAGATHKRRCCGR